MIKTSPARKKAVISHKPDGNSTAPLRRPPIKQDGVQATVDSGSSLTSAVINEIPKSAPEPGTHAWVKLSLITIRPQVRKKPVAPEDVVGLAVSAKQDTSGRKFYDHPVNVFIDSETGELVLLNGEQRTKSAKMDQWDFINATFVEMPTKTDVVINQLGNNEMANPMDPFDIAMGLKELERANLTSQEIALKMGKSQSYIKKFRMLMTLPDYIEEFGRNYLTSDVNVYTALKQLHRLSEKDCRELCNSFISRKKVSRSEIKSAIDMLNNPLSGPSYKENEQYTFSESSIGHFTDELAKAKKLTKGKAQVVITVGGVERKIDSFSVIKDDNGNQKVVLVSD